VLFGCSGQQTKPGDSTSQKKLLISYTAPQKWEKGTIQDVKDSFARKLLQKIHEVNIKTRTFKKSECYLTEDSVICIHIYEYYTDDIRYSYDEGKGNEFLLNWCRKRQRKFMKYNIICDIDDRYDFCNAYMICKNDKGVMVKAAKYKVVSIYDPCYYFMIEFTLLSKHNAFPESQKALHKMIRSIN
jgi:hypothetical protein